jgi:IclR family mhp operon transcriptional activator
MVGRSLPMLRTAAGRCYLACCPINERRAVLEMLSHSRVAEDQGAKEKQRLGALLDTIHANGFAVQDREINPKTSGMAIPIRSGSRILGCLSLIWISSALTIAEAEQQLLPPLRSIAQRIETAVRERSAGQDGYAA